MKKIVFLLTLTVCSIFSYAQTFCRQIIVKADTVAILDKDYYAVKKDGRWGVQKDDKIILPFVYDSIDVMSDGVITFVKNSKVGFADTTGKIISPNIYAIQTPYEMDNQSVLNEFSNGSALVYYNDKLMVLGKDGAAIASNKEIISKIANVIIFKQDGAYGMMDASGKILAQNKYRRIQTVIAGRLYAYTAQKNGVDYLGLIDAKGQIKSPAQYLDMTIVNKGENYYVKVFVESGKQAFYDQDGNLLFQPLYQNIEPTVSDFYFKITDNGNEGIIGRDYTIYVPTSYDNVKIAYVKTDTFFVATKENITYIIDKSNNVLDRFYGNIQDMVSYSNGEILYIADSMLNYGIRSNKKGWVVRPQFLDIFAMASDKLIVRKKDKWGVIDLNSNQIAPFEFKKVRASKSKTCIVLYAGKKESLIVRQDGTIISFPVVDKVLPLEKYIEYTYKKEKVRLFLDGTEIKGEYKMLGPQRNGILLVEDNKGFMYLNDKTLEPLNKEHYNYATQFDNSIAYVVKDKQLYMIDKDFNILQEVLDDTYQNLNQIAAFLYMSKFMGRNSLVVTDDANKKTVVKIYDKD